MSRSLLHIRIGSFVKTQRSLFHSTSQGLEPSAAFPQTLALLDGVRAEGEAGAEARRCRQGPATTTVRSCRLAHVSNLSSSDGSFFLF